MNKATLMKYEHERLYPVVTNTRTYQELATLAVEYERVIQEQQKRIDVLETGFIIGSRELQLESK